MNKPEPSKSAFRTTLRGALRALTDADRRRAAALALDLLQTQAVWHKAHSVLLFGPLQDELDIWPLVDLGLAAGKTIALPRFEQSTQVYTARQITQPVEDLCQGKFGIREPKACCPLLDLKRLDLVLAPGLGFDLRGVRLGRGKGFYDRLLSSVFGTICGVAYDRQIVSRLPAEPHDIHVHCILTPTRWIDLQAARRS